MAETTVTMKAAPPPSQLIRQAQAQLEANRFLRERENQLVRTVRNATK